MGNGGSKPEQVQFSADAPVRFSTSVLNSLQENPQTDATRAYDLELKKQTRKNEELTRQRDEQAQQLASLTASLTTNPPQEEEAAPHALGSLAAHFSSPFYQDHSGASRNSKMSDSGRSSESVNKEVADLRAKLDARKKVDQLPPGVEKAKESLVSCLRANDRRPLDCWQEVEAFKAEVGKLEKAFIEKTGR